MGYREGLFVVLVWGRDELTESEATINTLQGPLWAFPDSKVFPHWRGTVGNWTAQGKADLKAGPSLNKLMRTL